MTTAPNPYRGFRFPAEVIEHAVWLYHCFSLSLRDVETTLAARGIVVLYESIRDWGLRFGQMFANALQRRKARPGDKWHMDEVFIRTRGKVHYLWRAVSGARSLARGLWRAVSGARSLARGLWRAVSERPRAGHPGAEPAQHEGSPALFRKLLRGLQYAPRVIVTDKLKSYAAELCCREAQGAAPCRAPAEPLSQQPSRGVAPAHEATRAADAAVQVSASRATLPLHP
jgi:putative transposase